MEHGVTGIVASATAPKLSDGVITLSALPAVGDAPGVAAFVHYNGPTDQLSTLCTGMAVLAAGASPHPPHQHPEEEIIVIASGTGQIECAGTLTAVSPGSIMYCAGMVLHGILNTGTTPMTFYWSKWTAKGF